MPGFRLLTDRQLRRQARLDAQFAARAQARQINQEARRGERNVQGIAEALARAQGGYGAAAQDIYGRAQRTLGDLANSQRRTLGGTGPPPAGSVGQPGATLADTLGKNLALSGQGSDLANTLASATAGAANAGFGMGTAELGALAQRQAAAEDFGAKLPELARLTGLQGVQERAAQARRDQGALQAQAAKDTLQAIQNARSRRFNEGAANLAYTGKVLQEKAATARTYAQQAGANERNAASNQTRAQIAAANRRAAQAKAILQEGGRNARARAAAARQGRSVDVERSAQTGILHDKNGRVITWGAGPGKGKPVPWKPGKHGSGGKKPGKGKSGLG